MVTVDDQQAIDVAELLQEAQMWLQSFVGGMSSSRYAKKSSTRSAGADYTGLGRHELDIIFYGMQYGIPNRISSQMMRLTAA